MACFGEPRKMRSKPSSALAMPQPWLTAPTRFSSGTRTSLKNTSQNSPCSSRLRIGRTSTPGLSIGTSRKLMPCCALALRSVRASTKIQLASVPMVVQVFWPLITHSPSRNTASVRRLARSEPALGSL